MRILIYVFIGLWGYCGIYAQNKESLFGFTDLPQSLMINPGADVRFKFHAGVPFLSHIHVNAGFRGASVYDVFADDGRNINDKLATTLNKLNNKDHFAVNQQLEIANVGWRSKKDERIYFSAGMYQELDLIAYFPKDFAVLAYQGNRDFVNIPFNFSDISASGELFTVFHFGYNKKINKDLTFGARAKIYSSIINFRSNNNKGTFTTFESPQGNNIYQHVISGADVSVRTAGYSSLREIESEDTSDGAKQVLSKFLGRAFLGGNLGIGFDIGFTYKWDEQWSVSGSANDIGAIFYTKDVETYRARGSFVYEGLETPITSGTAAQDVLDELEDAIPIDTLSTSYVTARSLKLNGAIKYSFNKYDDGSCDCYVDGESPPYLDAFGMQLFTQFRPKVPQVGASFFYYKRWSNFFRTKVNYTIDDYSYKNISLLLSAHIDKINFYISANNLIEYSNLAKAQGATLQLGFNFIM